MFQCYRWCVYVEICLIFSRRKIEQRGNVVFFSSWSFNTSILPGYQIDQTQNHFEGDDWQKIRKYNLSSKTCDMMWMVFKGGQFYLRSLVLSLDKIASAVTASLYFGSRAAGGAVETALRYWSVATWRIRRSQRRVLVLFCSKNVLRNSPGERDEQAIAIKVMRHNLCCVCDVLLSWNRVLVAYVVGSSVPIAQTN